MITDVKIYYDDSAYGDLMQQQDQRNALFNPVSTVCSSYWYGIYSTHSSPPAVPGTVPDTGRDGEERKAGLYHPEFLIRTWRTVSGIENPEASAYVALYLSRTCL